MKHKLPLKIGISGVRGTIGESLTPQLVSRFAQAFGTFLGRGEVIIGRDTRSSGFMLTQSVISGLLSVGCRPVDAGICPIPTLQFLARESRYIGGLAVTASHNPENWNGLKFINHKGLFLNHAQSEEFLDIYHQGEFSLVRSHDLRVVQKEHRLEAHIQRLLDVVEKNSIRKKQFKVVADCCGGAGTVLMPRLLEELGCRYRIFDRGSGFKGARSYEPSPENLGPLCREVKQWKADIGLALDADADRLAIVNEKGEAVGEELTLALCIKHILEKNPGPVVVNLSTSIAVDKIAFENRSPVFRTKIGEIYVVEGVLKHKAVIGGEGNGGVIFPAVHTCRDSFSATGLILEFMATSGKTLSELRNNIPKFFMIKDRLPGTPEQTHRVIKKLRKRYESKGRISELDGLKISFNDAWLHIRPSNTEPIIRLIAEAATEEQSHTLLDTFKTEIMSLLKP
ncbi:MAG: phosphoglucosamine mutase [Candidatus Aminicenantes bacterium]|nr:phosphoglucosamine mutase [Candidatus Aminicenantes bacterium]